MNTIHFWKFLSILGAIDMNQKNPDTNTNGLAIDMPYTKEFAAKMEADLAALKLKTRKKMKIASYLFICFGIIHLAVLAKFQTFSNVWVQGGMVLDLFILIPVLMFWNKSIGIQESVFSYYYSADDFELLRLDCVEYDDRAAAQFLNAIKNQNRMITHDEVRFIGEHINRTIRKRDNTKLEENFSRLLS